MTILTRRSVLRTSLALGAAGILARPYIAKAQAKTATVWWVQGFAEEEDISFKKIVADYQKASGNTIEYTITPYAPLRQKIVAAIQTGVVPDMFTNNPGEIIALYAWDDKLADVTDVVETQKSQYSETALHTAYCYNRVTKKRSFYGAPYTLAARPNHIWRSEEHTSELQSPCNLVCRLLLEKKKIQYRLCHSFHMKSPSTQRQISSNCVTPM